MLGGGLVVGRYEGIILNFIDFKNKIFIQFQRKKIHISLVNDIIFTFTGTL